jgi:hypothetical protein
MFSSSTFERIFLEAFRKANKLPELGKGVTFTELVILLVMNPEGYNKFLGPDSALSASDLFTKIENLYYPFPPPFQMPSFYEALRKMPDKTLVKVTASGRPRYLATAQARLLLQLEIVKLAREPRADTALFIINAAILHKEHIKIYRKYFGKIVNKFSSFLGVDLSQGSELAYCGINVQNTIRTEILAQLETAGEHTLCKQLVSKSDFKNAVIHVLDRNTANEDFFIRCLTMFREYFKEKINQAKDDDESGEMISCFKKIKCKHYSELCDEAIKMLK